MPKYKVIAYGGMDGLKFPDLLVKYSTGYLIPLHIKEGEYIPLEILDPLDVKKSLLVGSLGRYIAGGEVLVEEDAIIKTVQIPKVEQTQVLETIPQQTPSVVASQPQPMQVETKVEEQLTNLSQVKNIDDFFKLGYFLKLRFIRECNDKALLNQLFNKAESKQLQNNIQLRLSGL